MDVQSIVVDVTGPRWKAATTAWADANAATGPGTGADKNPMRED